MHLSFRVSQEDPSIPCIATKQKQRAALSSLLHVTFDIGNQDSNPHHRLPSRMSVSQSCYLVPTKRILHPCSPNHHCHLTTNLQGKKMWYCTVLTFLRAKWHHPYMSPTCGPPHRMSFDSVV
jgi:hypothetical protein